TFDKAGRSDREIYLRQQANFVVRPEHYYRFPEILGASTLAEQLRALGFEDRADGVAILIAANAPVLQRLPAVDKSLPAKIIEFIRKERARLAKDSQTGETERYD